MAAITIALSIGGWILRCKACLAVLCALALLLGGGIYGVTVEKARSEARIARMKHEADEAAAARDKQISEDLERKYAPVVGKLNADKAALEEKVRDYAKRKPAQSAARPASCKLGDAAGLLRPHQSR